MIDFIIHNAKLLDVVAGERRPGASIRVESGRIGVSDSASSSRSAARRAKLSTIATS